MGLDTTYDAWSGSYSSFFMWRVALARAAGYPIITEDERFKNIVRYELPWEDYTEENYQGIWKEIPSDPLILLLAHSDCDGVIKAEHLEPLATRLEELLPALEPGDEYAGMHWLSNRGRAEAFISGLRAAADVGDDIEFH